MIYLDHNATTPLHPRALEAMLPLLRESWGNPSSPYRFGVEARRAVEQARAGVSELVGCTPGEIIFSSGGTEADNLALRGVAYALRGRGNHIVTTAIEHHAVLTTARALEAEGFDLTIVPVTSEGLVDPEALTQSLRRDTILVSVMHANNETGVIQPLDRIAAITKAHRIVLHTDAVQTAGKLGIRLADLGADLVSFSGHKFYGPKGTAALFVRLGTPIVPLLTGGRHELGLRAGTENVAGIVGFAEALRCVAEDSDAEGPRLSELRDRLECETLARIPGVTINGARAPRVPNTSNMAFANVDGESIVLALDVEGISVSTGSACATADPEPSHVLTAMGLSRQRAQGAVRFSLGRSTRAQDIVAMVPVLTRTIERLRAISSVSFAPDSGAGRGTALPS